jgi:glycosyltransferase involved in cell wall biosynthesis
MDVTRLPAVSVVMGVYNGELYLAGALESILSQTFMDFEFIVVNDGSTDSSAEILRSTRDPRLRTVEQANAGLTRSLNRGIALAQGEYVARMDADDTCMPQRLAAQVAYMERHPATVLLGTAYQHVDLLRDRQVDIYPPGANETLRLAMVSGNPFCHSSVMMRRSALEKVGGYDENFRYVQDYELWSRLALVGEMANLSEILIARRYHAGSVSNNWRTELLRLWLFARANWLAIARLGFPPIYRLYTVKSISLFVAVDVLSYLRCAIKKITV